MKTIKVHMYVATRYVGSAVEETVEIEVEDDASQEDIEKEIQEYYDEWVWGELDSGWSIEE